MPLAAIPAKWIDDIKCACSNPETHRFHHYILGRLIGVTVLPLFNALDAAYEGGKTLKAWVFSRKEDAAASYELFKKNVYGVVFAPFSLIYIDLVARSFLRKVEEPGIVRPYGKLYAQKVEVMTPTSIEEVQEILREAKKNGKKIGIAGARFSQGEQILPSKSDQILLDMKKLNRVQIDPKTKVLKVGGGAIWKDVQDEANKHDLAEDVQQASNVFSSGGSISINCHGWSKRGAIGNTLKSLTIVDANGEIKKLLPHNDLFKAVVGGLGLIAVIVEAEIELVRNDLLNEEGIPVRVEDYVGYYYKKVLPDPAIKMQLYRLDLTPGKLLQRGWSQSYRLAEGPLPDPSKPLPNEPDDGHRFDRIALQAARRKPDIIKSFMSMESKKILNERLVTRNEAMRPTIMAAVNNSMSDCEWLQEFFLKGEDLAPFLKELGKTLTENEVTLFNASVRFVPQDSSSHLPYAKDGDRFAVVLFFNQYLAKDKVAKTEAWVRKMYDYVTERGGSFYLPYQSFATKEQFRKSYPSWPLFVAKKRQYDPENRFDTGLYQKYFHTKRNIRLVSTKTA